MKKDFEEIAQGIFTLLAEWEPKLKTISIEVIDERQNSQNRTIKQIVGHMIDSASNNTHRVVHLQYQQSPFQYPNYASQGNNDRWIAIQNYQEENWLNLIQLWKYSNLHFAYIIQHINPEKIDNEWIAGPEQNISLNTMVIDYLRHLKLHMKEIEELINEKL